MGTATLSRSGDFPRTASTRIEAVLSSPVVWLAFLSLGVAARCRQYFGCPSYWYDEAYLLLNIFEKSYAELIAPLQYNVVIPPLFLWLLRALYTVMGPSELAMRLPAFVAGIAALLVMIPLARCLAGKPGWLWAVGFCALSDHALMHGCEVRPYTCDLLITETILMAAYTFLSPTAESRGRCWGLGGLLCLAMLAPWLSFPSVFVLAGTSLALLTEAVQRRQLMLWLSWLALNGLLLCSALALWFVVGRHLYYPGLQEHWTVGWNGFPDLSSPRTALAWPLRCVVEIGDYGTSGMGIPLLLLGVVGGMALWKRSRSLTVLLVSPVLIAGVAAFLRRYPMGDRTVFFAVPCFWLLAATGIGTLLDHFRGRIAWAALGILAALLVPDAVRMVKSVVLVQPKVEFREAFAYVREHWSAGDALWVSHPEVYAVYFGRDTNVLGYDTPLEKVEQVAREGRLWTITIPQDAGKDVVPGLFERLETAQTIPLQRYRVKGLEVILHVPK